jgi:hypothetical protein
MPCVQLRFDEFLGGGFSLIGPSRSFRPLPHVTATYQEPSAFFRAYEIGGETRSVLASMQSKYHRLIATVMPENPLPGDAQLVAAMQPRARLWIIADSGKQARRWRVGRLDARCSGDDDPVTVRAATVLSVSSCYRGGFCNEAGRGWDIGGVRCGACRTLRRCSWSW